MSLSFGVFVREDYSCYIFLKFAPLGWRPRAKNNRASTLWINSSKNAIYILNNALESNKTRDRSFEKPQSVFSENQPMSLSYFFDNGVGDEYFDN